MLKEKENGLMKDDNHDTIIKLVSDAVVLEKEIDNFENHQE